MKSYLRVLLALVAVFVVTIGAVAQAGQGSVEGTVTDPSGAVVPGASLKLTNTATNLSFNAASNEAGYFRFPVVPVGSYDLVAEGKSFSTYNQKGVPVTVGSRVNLPITLGLKNKGETVEVTGELPIVETTRSTL